MSNDLILLSTRPSSMTLSLCVSPFYLHLTTRSPQFPGGFSDIWEVRFSCRVEDIVAGGHSVRYLSVQRIDAVTVGGDRRQQFLAVDYHLSVIVLRTGVFYWIQAGTGSQRFWSLDAIAWVDIT